MRTLTAGTLQAHYKNMTLKKGKLYEGKVTEYRFPDTGVVSAEGEKVLVKGALPGQCISFYITRRRSGTSKGRLAEVLERSPLELQEPSCPHFGICGGCTYQNVAYEDQLKLKAECVRKLITAADAFDPPCKNAAGNANNIFEGIFPSSVTCAYRNKMEYTFGDEYKGGPLALGLHKKGSFYDVVNTDGCSIVHEDFNMIRSAVRDFFAGYYSRGEVDYHHRRSHDGYLRHLLLRRSVSTGRILAALITTTADKSPALAGDEAAEQDLITEFSEMLKSLKLEGRIAGAFHVYNNSLSDVVQSDETILLFGEDHITEEILGLKFRISLFSFFQTNSKGAEVLYSKAREYAIGQGTGVQSAQCGDAAVSAGDRSAVPAASLPVIYDLYCGTGTITQLMSSAASRAIGIEIVEEAVEAAKKNAVMNGISNTQFIAGDVMKVLCGEIGENLPHPDLIILDPPREGVHPKALAKILSFGVQNIIYISCKPTSLAAELETFKAAGYRIQKYACVDMFPGTVHVETVCLLGKRKPDTTVRIGIDMEDYYRIREAEKTAEKSL